MVFNITPWGITGNFAGAGEPSRIEWNKKVGPKSTTKKKTKRKKRTKKKKK